MEYQDKEKPLNGKVVRYFFPLYSAFTCFIHFAPFYFFVTKFLHSFASFYHNSFLIEAINQIASFCRSIKLMELVCTDAYIGAIEGRNNEVDQKPHFISLVFTFHLLPAWINLRSRLSAFFQLIFSDFTAYGLGHEQTGVQAYVVVSQRVEAEYQRLIRDGKLKE